MSHSPARLTVLISGTGSNLQSLINAIASNTLANTTIVRVVSNRKNAMGLVRAQEADIKTSYHNLVPYKSSHPTIEAARAAYDADLASLVLADKPDLVVMAGFIHIVSPSFLVPLEAARPRVRCINLHPSLPGQHIGMKAIDAAWDRFQKGELEGGKTGVMVHYVIEELDMGEAIAVREIEIREGESKDDFEIRMHELEHEIIVDGVREAMKRLWLERGQDVGH